MKGFGKQTLNIKTRACETKETKAPNKTERIITAAQVGRIHELMALSTELEPETHQK